MCVCSVRGDRNRTWDFYLLVLMTNLKTEAKDPLVVKEMSRLHDDVHYLNGSAVGKVSKFHLRFDMTRCQID